MFEGKPPRLPAAKGAFAGDSEMDSPGEALSSMTWADLVAKLDAARDLRAELDAELHQSDDPGDASFDAFCAEQLAQQHERAEEESKHLVNPDDLANGKPRGCKDDERSQSDMTANRGHK